MSLAGPDSLVRNAPLPFAAGVSLAFGLLGFFSPCVLPLVPGYLSFLASSVGGADRRPRAVLGAALFVLGFSAVLVVEGTAFGAFAMAFRQDAPVIQRVLGAVTVVLGLAYLGWLRIPQVAIDARAVSRFGWLGAPLVGAAFGIAWGPCLTPEAGAVFALAYDQTGAGRGAVLMLCYGCGLGVPFIAAAWGSTWLTRVSSVVRAHRVGVRRVGGATLVVLGVALATGVWPQWSDWLRSRFG